MPSFQRRRLDDGSTSWVALVRIKGFAPVSKAFRDERNAKSWAKATETELRALRERGASKHESPRLKIGELCRLYLDDPKTRAGKSYESLEPLVCWWASHYGGERVMGFGVTKVREARDRLIPDRSPATTNRYLSAMRACWNWGRNAGLVPNDSLWPGKVMLKEPPGRARFLDDEELDAVLDDAATGPDWFEAAVLVAIGTGIRQGELLKLRWRDVDLASSRVVVQETKNATPRAVHLPGPAVKVLKALRRDRGLDDPVIPMTESSLNQRWNQLRERVGLDDFKWHDLRHTCASYLAQGGASLLEIGSVLGHKSPSVTMRYSHLVQGAPLAAHSKLEGKLRR
jgi:integrase